MAGRASVAGHPIHPMLVPIPIGLFVFSPVADVIVYFGGAGAWPAVAFYCMGGGIVGALLAAVFGLIDLLSLTEERVRRIGTAHMIINLTVVALFVVNFWLRWQGDGLDGTPFILSLIAVGLLAISGWLGGHMVFVHGVAVGRGRPVFERRKVQVPVRQERRKVYPGAPLGQH
jgi:uncharacterized membrane protein